MTRNYSLLCLFGILFCFVSSTVGRTAIVGGEFTKDHQFPYQVSIQVPVIGHKCGGGIIGNNFILTAAHCVFQNNGSIITSMFVHAGTNQLLNTNPPAVNIPVKKIYVPSYFKQSVGSNGDIAVLQLSRPLGLSPYNHHLKALKIARPDSEDFHGKVAVIAGFGFETIGIQDNPLRGRLSEQLKYTKADVLNYWPRGDEKVNLPPNILCARVKQQDVSKPHGVCNGDSGGPLVHGETVIGILSIGPNNCAETKMPAIYSRVSFYFDLIQHAVHDKHHNDINTFELSH